jgi:hypothetical protein
MLNMLVFRNLKYSEVCNFDCYKTFGNCRALIYSKPLIIWKFSKLSTWNWIVHLCLCSFTILLMQHSVVSWWLCGCWLSHIPPSCFSKTYYHNLKNELQNGSEVILVNSGLTCVQTLIGFYIWNFAIYKDQNDLIWIISVIIKMIHLHDGPFTNRSLLQTVTTFLSLFLSP